MIIGPGVKAVDEQTYERMDGLISKYSLERLETSVNQIMFDLTQDGFSTDGIYRFLVQKMVEATSLY